MDHHSLPFYSVDNLHTPLPISWHSQQPSLSALHVESRFLLAVSVSFDLLLHRGSARRRLDFVILSWVPMVVACYRFLLVRDVGMPRLPQFQLRRYNTSSYEIGDSKRIPIVRF
jgi:hypothetical protein